MERRGRGGEGVRRQWGNTAGGREGVGRMNPINQAV